MFEFNENVTIIKQIEPTDVELVEEDLSSISYEEHSEIGPREALNESKVETTICLAVVQSQEQDFIYLRTDLMGKGIQESSSREKQMVDKESFSMTEHRIEQNIEKVRICSGQPKN